MISPESTTNDEDRDDDESYSDDDDAYCVNHHESCIYFKEGITPRSNQVDPCPYWEYTWSNAPLTRDNAPTLSPSFIQLPKHAKTIRLGITSFDLKVSEDINIYCYLNHRERQLGWDIQIVTCICEPQKMVELKHLEEYDGGDEMLAASITNHRTEKGAITLTFRFYMAKSEGSHVYNLCDVRLGEDLWEAAVKQQMTDVVFIVRDRSFPAHKFLLAARSPVFSAMFGTDMMESRTGRVKVDDVDPETFQQFLRFLYTGQLEEPASEEVAYVADKYDVKTLTAICESAFSFFSDMDADDSFDSLGSTMAADASDPALLPFQVQRKADSFWINEDVSVAAGDPSSAVCQVQGHPEFRYALRDRRLAEELWSSSFNQEWTDVDFVVRGKTFSAHRALLAARCPALIPLGSNDSSPPVRIENVEASAFQKLLYFIYTGELQTFPPSKALYKAALILRVLRQATLKMRSSETLK